MIITFITPEYPPEMVGGLGTHVQELARGLSAAGIEVHVFAAGVRFATSHQDGKVSVHYIAVPEAKNKTPYSLSLEAASSLNRRVATTVREYFLRLNKRPSVIHIHDWYGFEAADWLRSAFEIPVITTIHALVGPILELYQIPLAGNEVIKLERRCCQGSNRMIAVSKSVAEDLERLYSVPRHRVNVVWNGFDIGRFLTRHEKSVNFDSICNSLLKNGEQGIVFAGRLAPHKGVLPLLRSAKQVIAEIKNVRYLIAGELRGSRYLDILRSVVAEDPMLAEKITFVGMIRREHLAALYQLSTLAVVPSLYEPFGYAAIEPMSVGRPVVAAQVGGLNEIIVHDHSGILVPTGISTINGVRELDPSKLAEAQLQLLSNPAKAKGLGKEAQCQVMRQFSVQRMVEETHACYAAAANHYKRATASY